MPSVPPFGVWSNSCFDMFKRNGTNRLLFLIAAFCKRDPFNDFIAALESGILESDEENIVPLDLELPEFVSSYSNIKIVISLSPTFTNGKLLSQPVNFQLNLPETNSQKYCQLVSAQFQPPCFSPSLNLVSATGKLYHK